MRARIPRAGGLAGLALALAAWSCAGEEGAPAAAGAGFAGDVEGFDLEAYEGRVVVLNFWATWCVPCRFEIPALVRLRRDFEEVAVVGISIDRGTVEQVGPLIERFVSRFEINYPVYLDAEQKVARNYAGSAPFMMYVPTTAVIDQGGRVVKLYQGVPGGGLDPYEELAAQVDALLGGA